MDEHAFVFKVGNPNRTGNVAEAGFGFHALKAGLTVFAPVGEHGAADLVLETESRLIRVQIKAGRLSSDGSVISVRLERSRHSPTNGYVFRRYTPEEVDAFGVYCEELDRCYLIPLEDVADLRSIHLRLTEARNKQRASLRFAADYEFHGAVAQLGERSAGSRKVVGSIPISSTKEPAPASHTTVGAHEFRERFGWYMERAAAGESFQVTRRGKPHVQLLPPGAAQPRANEAD